MNVKKWGLIMAGAGFAVLMAAHKVHEGPGYITPDQARQLINMVKEDHPEVRGLPEALILGIIETESGFNTRAVGSVGERGLMQLKPRTYNWIMGAYGKPAGDIFDPYYNILAGMLYLKWLKDREGTNDVPSMVQAYNRGRAGYLRGERNYDYLVSVLVRAGKFLIV